MCQFAGVAIFVVASFITGKMAMENDVRRVMNRAKNQTNRIQFLVSINLGMFIDYQRLRSFDGCVNPSCSFAKYRLHCQLGC